MNRLLLLLLLSVLWITVFSQIAGDVYKMEVSVNKTTSLVFPSPIISVDRGSSQIITQKAGENVLRVKSALVSIRETNLTVVTADGKLYSFLVVYAENPAQLTLYMGQEKTVRMVNRLTGICDSVARLKSNVAGAIYSSGRVSMQLLGWYVRGANMYCKLKFENRSQIGYDIEQAHWYLRDNNAARRTASQERMIQPLFVTGDTGMIKAHSSRIWVVAVEKFTIPDEKHFLIEILERNGGRHLYLKSTNRQVMLAKEF